MINFGIIFENPGHGVIDLSFPTELVDRASSVVTDEEHGMIRWCTHYTAKYLKVILKIVVYRQDKPSTDDKEDMAESIVNAFHILKDDTPSGYVSIGIYIKFLVVFVGISYSTQFGKYYWN